LWLDGEIWFGQNEQKLAVRIAITSSLGKIPWDKFQYMAFDTPHTHREYLFRYSKLRQTFAQRRTMHDHACIRVVRFVDCSSKQYAEDIYNTLLSLQAEGMIARQPFSLYCGGYSTEIFKFKNFRDHEALVVKNMSNGRWMCKMAPLNGSTQITMEMTIDKDFVGELSEVREGAIVSFKFSGYYNLGRPMNPRIFCVRKDIRRWDDLLLQNQGKSPPERQRHIYRPPVLGNWRQETQRRKFFEELAADLGYGNTDAETWLEKISLKDVVKKKGGYAVLAYYKMSYPKAITELYPELALTIESFHKNARVSLTPQERSRQFFNQLANDKKFDPLDASQWYTLSALDVRGRKGSRPVLENHKGSHIQALIDTYPELHLKRNKFSGVRKGWNVNGVHTRRDFFDQFARASGFNPLDSEQWYSVSAWDVRKGGGRSIVEYHNESHIQALIDLYPELNLERGRFARSTMTD